MARFPVLLLLAGACVFGDDRAMSEAVAAMKRGDYTAAERIMRAEVAARPNEAMVQSLLGATLDAQGKSGEAAPFHRRAAAIAPRNADVLSNFGYHLSAIDDVAEHVSCPVRLARELSGSGSGGDTGS